MRGMARRVWLAGWASHRLELTATSPLIDLCTPVGKHTRGRPGKSRSCDGQGRRSVVTDKAGDHVTQHDARPALARSAPTHQAPVGYSPPWCFRHVRSLFPRFDLFPRGIRTSFPQSDVLICFRGGFKSRFLDPRHCQSVGVNSDPSGYWVNVGLYICNLITHQSRVAAASCFIRKYCANQGLSAPATTERGTRSTQAWSLWDLKLVEVHGGGAL